MELYIYNLKIKVLKKLDINLLSHKNNEICLVF